MTTLEISDLTCGYKNRAVIKNVSFSALAGDFIAIMGPNGCGKTTLLKAISNFIKSLSGSIKVDGQEVSKISRKELAQKIAFVPQMPLITPGFTVRELIAMGRSPHLDIFGPSVKDNDMVEKTIELLFLQELVSKDVSQLSGGEYQRVLIARAIAQEAKILLLDEPISHLDPKYQFEIMYALESVKESTIVLSTFHDNSFASAFCSRLIYIKNGLLAVDIKPEEYDMKKIHAQVYDF